MTPQQMWFDLPMPGSRRSRAGVPRRRRLRLSALVVLGVTVVGVLVVSGLVELVG